MKITRPHPESEKEKSSVSKRIAKGVLLLLLAASLFCYRDALGDIMGGIRSVTWIEIAVSAGLSVLGYLLEGLTIFVMMGAVGPGARTWDGIFIALVCEFYRLTTLGSGSGVAQIHYLHEKEMEPGSATILTMIQYIMKRAAIMALGVAGYLYLCHKEATRAVCREYLLFVGLGCLITGIVIVCFLCVALSSRVANALLWGIDRLALKVRHQEENFEKWREQILLLNRSGRSILAGKKRMLGVVGLQLGKLGAFYLIPACLMKGKIGLTVGECMLVMAVAYMLSGVIPAPSGMGALEFVFLLFFNCFIDLETAVPVILLFRFVTWILPAAVGGVFLLGRRWFRQPA